MSGARPDTWMPLYWGDYLRDTSHLSAAEHGAYLLLIGHYWTNGGPFEDDDDRLARVARMLPKEWRKARATIASFFRIEGGQWRHGRIDKELSRAVAKTEAKAEAGKKGGGAKWGSDRDIENQRTRSQRLAEARQRGTHTAEEWAALIDVFEGSCVRCGDATDKPVKDHIVPIYKGGSDALANLQPLCRTCNSSKGPEAIDHRSIACQDWQKRLAERLAHVRQTPAPSQPPPHPSEAKASSGESAPASPPPPAPKAPRGTRLPEDWMPSPILLAWAKDAFPDFDTDRETEKFRDWALSAPGQKGVKRDWDAAWRNWMRRAYEEWALRLPTPKLSTEHYA